VARRFVLAREDVVMPKRVVITGLGVISSIGIGKGEFWTNALAGVPGTVRLDFDWVDPAKFSTLIGAPVQGFDASRYNIPSKDISILDLVTQFALATTEMALGDAGLEFKLVNPKKGFHEIQAYPPERIAVSIGTGIGGLVSLVSSHSIWLGFKESKVLKRYSLPMLIPNAPSAYIAIKYQAKGECKTVTTACSAGTMAIGDAYRMIVQGEVDMAIAGGVDAFLSDEYGYGLKGFDLLNTMSRRNDDPERASRPFDRDRDGFVMSEGAGLVILEELGCARARGAHVYAELAGYDTNCDAFSIMQMDPSASQVTRVMKIAVERAGVSTEDVDYINAHGTATVLNDKVETQAIKQVFGERAYDLLVSSLKSMTGHAIGASGSLECISTALTIDEGLIPPTINLDNPDDECDLNYVPHKYTAREVQVALTNSFAFGGHNSCLVLRKLE
jgi:3-oxoacyl-[acyl-carrier-protein] synthase II